MRQVEPFEIHAEEYDQWYDSHEKVYESEVIAIRHQMQKLPENIHGIEVGLGTGRFAAPLGIKEGVDPSENMRKIAVKRGIEVMDAVAEFLPYKSLRFDFVLFVTICHLDNVPLAFSEAHRVLKNGGSVIVAFIKRGGDVAKEYMVRKDRSSFYKHADFFTVERVIGLLEKAGFKNFDIVQTLFGGLDDIDEIQYPKEGHEEGSFIVIKGDKR